MNQIQFYSFYNDSCVCVCVCVHACARMHTCVLGQVQCIATLWTVACQASLSLGFSQEEYWSGLPFPPPGGLPDPGTEPEFPAWQADS